MDPNDITDQAGTPAPDTEDQQAVEAEAAASPAPPAEDPIDGTLKAMLGDDAQVDAPKPPEQAATTPELSKPGTQQQVAEPNKPEDAKAAVDAEVASLGLKEKAAARFHELAARAAEAEQFRGAAERAQQWEERILSTGANPEQFGQAMNYLTLLNSGDPANLELAFQQVEGEYLALARALGKPAGGAIDPLDDHPDLAEKVANMDMDRATAMEVAGMRAQMRLREASTQVRTQQDAYQKARQDGAAQLVALETELRASDPVGYDIKLKALTPALTEAVNTLPPERWAPFARKLFSTIPAVPEVPAPAAVQQPAGLAPLRASAPASAPVRRVVDDVDATMAAMMAAGK